MCTNIVVNNQPEDGLVVECLDGASVNQGELNGVAAKQKEWAEQSETTHSVAHVNQICTGKAFEEDAYYQVFRDIVNRVVAHYSRSGKKKAALERITELLCPGSSSLKLPSLHGIRWEEAASRTLQTLFWMLPTIVTDLTIAAQEAFDASCKSILTDNILFIKDSLKEQVDVGEGRKSWRTFTVQSFDDVLRCSPFGQ